MHDEEFHSLESRLRADATRLTQAITPAVVSPQQLLTRHKQQHLSRWPARVIGSTVLVLISGGIWWSTSTRRLEAPPRDRQIVQPQATHRTVPMPNSATIVATSPAAAAKTHNDQTALASLKRLTAAGALPVMLVRTSANGKPVLVPGLYVPRRKQRVEFSQLKPVQQRAVLTVLGLPIQNRRDHGI